MYNAVGEQAKEKKEAKEVCDIRQGQLTLNLPISKNKVNKKSPQRGSVRNQYLALV